MIDFGFPFALLHQTLQGVELIDDRLMLLINDWNPYNVLIRPGNYHYCNPPP
jgi:hypothetical protein